jgi:hypothetical protein
MTSPALFPTGRSDQCFDRNLNMAAARAAAGGDRSTRIPSGVL